MKLGRGGDGGGYYWGRGGSVDWMELIELVTDLLTLPCLAILSPYTRLSGMRA